MEYSYLQQSGFDSTCNLTGKSCLTKMRRNDRLPAEERLNHDQFVGIVMNNLSNSFHLGMGPSVTEPSQLSGANSFYRFDFKKFLRMNCEMF